MSGLDLTTKVKVVTLAPKQTLLRVQSRGMQGPPGVQGPPGGQGPKGDAGTSGDEYGIFVTGGPVPAGGYPAARSARASGSFIRFFAEVDAVCTIEVRVGGVLVHTAENINGAVVQAANFLVAPGQAVDFWLVEGTPTSVWAQVDGGSS